MSGLVRRLAQLLRGTREIGEEVDEEIRFHLEMRAAELEGRGMKAAVARREAIRQFGDLEATRAICYEADLRRESRMRRREYLSEMGQDLRHALRQLRRRPGFGVVVVLTLGLGIGAATAVFGLADHVLLRPLPYEDPERVVTLWEVDRATGEDHREVSPGNFLDWRDRSRSFEAIGLGEPYGVDLTGEGPPAPLTAWLVTEQFFPALGVEPVLGRGFRPEDFHPNAAPVAMISHALWWRLGSDPSLVGRAIELDGVPVTVLGVLPAWLEYPEKADVWAPKHFLERELQERLSAYMRVVARLRSGTTLEEAQADLDRVSRLLAAEHPRTNGDLGVKVVALEEQVLGGVRPVLLVLLGAVGLLVLIASSNVASLLLARGAERRHELGVRTALGAGRWRLARQLLTESALLGVLGGVAGAALAPAGMRLLVALSPADLPRLDSVAPDWRVLGFACLLTVATTLVFGLAPALRLSSFNPIAALRGGAASLTAGRDRLRLRGTLVIGQIAIATVLLIGAGLLARSFVQLLERDPGFTVERRAVLQLFIGDRNPTREQRIQEVAEMTAEMESLPGIDEVAVVSALPFHPQQIDVEDALEIRGRVVAQGQEARVFTTVASPNYFSVMGIPVQRGRGFTAGDGTDAPAVAVINETLARRHFPGEDPVGKHVTIGVMSRPLSREIVGVVGDVRPMGLDSDARPELYIPYAQSGTYAVTFVARTRSDPEAMLPALKSRVWAVDPLQTIDHASTVEALISETLVARRFGLVLLASFSLVALALAAIGIYGLISFATSQRMQEIGVRLALGARPDEVVAMIVREGLRLGVPGILLGIAGALVLTRFMTHMLFEVAPTDPATFVRLSALLLLVSLLGAYLPARRAARVDPALALRGRG